MMNGSGISLFWGPGQLAWMCQSGWLGSHDEFTQVNSIKGACNADVNHNTLAQGSPDMNMRPSQCNVFMVGVGMKKVTDRCADCWHGGTEGHLDNYTSQALANCARAATGLGTYQTIFMSW